MTWGWQEPIVAVIVGWAVVSLYRHLRGMLSAPAPESGGGASCHGCDDGCADDETGARLPADR